MIATASKFKRGTFTTVPNIDRIKQGILSCEAQSIYLWLVIYSDENGVCFPSRKTLANNIKKKSPKTIDKYIEELIDNGFIAKEKRIGSDQRSMTNIYQIITPISEGDLYIAKPQSH